MTTTIQFQEPPQNFTHFVVHVSIAACALALCACGSDGTDSGNNGGHAPSAGGSSGAAGQATGGSGSAGSTNAGGSAGAPNTGGTGGSGTGGSGTGGSGTGGSGNSGGSSGSVWHPAPGTSWQWQLTGTLDTSLDVAMYDIDLFETDASAISSLHSAGRIVICYFSAGSREDWRPDAGDFDAADYGNGLDGWPGETWLDTRSQHVRTIMKTRLDQAKSKGCDGVEPDNMDAYANNSGFPLQESDQLDYDGFIATEAHARGLSVGLKNSVELASALEPQFDWTLNEECLSYSECSSLKPFIDAGKAVFHVEYSDSQSQGQAKLDSVCGDSSIQGFSTLIKLLDLDAWRLACP